MSLDWYWNKGLHDAEIIDCQEHGLFYNYEEPNPIRNYLELTIDSKHALWNCAIKRIKLYNYKILSELKSAKGIWWLEDSIKEEKGKYVLTIKGHNKEEFVVRFDKAEVVR